MQEKYFHTNEYYIPLTTSRDESALLEYYLTDSELSFYFVYTAVQIYNIPIDALNDRVDRQYDRTTFFYLLKSKGKGDKELIVTYLYSLSKSWSSKDKGIDLNHYLSKLMTKANDDAGECKRFVFFVYLKKIYAKKYFILNQAPTPYPVFFFSSYTNILNDLKKLHFKDAKIQARKKNLNNLLCDMKECSVKDNNQKIDSSTDKEKKQDELFELKKDYIHKLKNIFHS